MNYSGRCGAQLFDRGLLYVALPKGLLRITIDDDGIRVSTDNWLIRKWLRFGAMVAGAGTRAAAQHPLWCARWGEVRYVNVSSRSIGFVKSHANNAVVALVGKKQLPQVLHIVSQRGIEVHRVTANVALLRSADWVE